MTTGAILLAAGSARRMGEDKLLADLGGRPLILHAFETILAAGFENPIVAISPGSRVGPLLAGRATLVEVVDHAEGMGSSLAAAISRAPSTWIGAVICLGDMPFILPATLSALAHQTNVHAIVRPAFRGRPGNPVWWGRSHFPGLAALRGEQGGRALFDAHPVGLLECNDPGIAIDIDTPEALAAARARLERP